MVSPEVSLRAVQDGEEPVTSLSCEKLFLAAGSYTRYLLGVQTLHNPESTRALHTPGDLSIELANVVVSSTKLIWHGLRETIKAVKVAAPSNKSGDDFDYQAEHLWNFVDSYYGNDITASRANGINPQFSIIRPAPFQDPNLYKQLCEDRTDRLPAQRLMGGVVINPLIDPAVAENNHDQLIGVFVPRKDWQNATNRAS